MTTTRELVRLVMQHEAIDLAQGHSLMHVGLLEAGRMGHFAVLKTT